MAGMLANFTMANSKGLYPKLGSGSGRTRRRKVGKKAARSYKRVAKARKRTRKSAARPARLVKGSPAARRYMAKIRKMRRR